MKEDFLHYIWKYRKYNHVNLTTTRGERIEVMATGSQNTDAGPDFFNARLSIDEQLWAGTVEIHLRSSHWYLHNHETDAKYENVILHVVWEDDVDIYRRDNTPIPTLVLKNITDRSSFRNYQRLINGNKSFINCEKQLEDVPYGIVKNWMDTLFIKRFEAKSAVIMEELKRSGNDWEATLFRLLMKNFGLKVNADAFYNAASLLDFSVVRKTRHDILDLEALLFGTCGLLSVSDVNDEYLMAQKGRYAYLRRKYQLEEYQGIRPVFFRLRPLNFPTIRISQLANLYATYPNLFSLLLKAQSKKELYGIFDIGVCDYWKTHYTFGKRSGTTLKKMSSNFIDLLIINTIAPLKFCYARFNGRNDDHLMRKLLFSIKPEKNRIVDHYEALSVPSGSAAESQSLLQLYHHYCTVNKCLDCAVGNHLIKGKLNSQ
ncbi:DUF2851 family protein [Ascidiimonas aurantiaca]|uniref:DUF2851 family protein n=1 Tax=Ascidiimonas aurantiaca TaxID=1685432 RepID=UPI0030EDC597